MKAPSEFVRRRVRASCLNLFTLVAVLATACGGGEDSTGDQLVGSAWEMTSVWDGTDLVPANPTTIATLEFAGGTATGSTGCNLFQSPYSITSDSITFGDPALTGSACNPSYVGQGTAFVQAMQASTRVLLSDDSLELTDAGGATQLRFRPAGELPLEWVTWQLTWYGGGTAPLEGAPFSLAFRPDGTLGGIAGCNDYSADYSVDGTELEIGPIARTEKACLKPEGVMSQESEYLDTLQQARAFTTTLVGLELLDADGTPIAEYRFGGRTR